MGEKESGAYYIKRDVNMSTDREGQWCSDPDEEVAVTIADRLTHGR